MERKEPPHERNDLYEDDLTDERGPTPAERDDAAHNLVLDPQTDKDEPDGVLRPQK
jgi:hypothetical protein